MLDLRKNPAATSRGIRNNNPFNLVKTAIKWQGKTAGTDSRFETFESVEYGIRAGIIDIIGDIGNKGQDTIKKLITVFAPPHENDTTAYIRYVEGVTGVNQNDSLIKNGKVDQVLLGKLITAIINKENGAAQAKLIPAASIQKAIDLALNNPTGKKFILPLNGSKNPINKDITGTLFMILLAGIIVSTFIK